MLRCAGRPIEPAARRLGFENLRARGGGVAGGGTLDILGEEGCPFAELISCPETLAISGHGGLEKLHQPELLRLCMRLSRALFEELQAWTEWLDGATGRE